MVTEMLGLVASSNGAKFANLTYRSKGTGEYAKYQLILGASTENLYKKDIVMLECWQSATPIEARAVATLLASRLESLRVGIGNNSAYVHQDTYITLFPGVKVHKESGELHVMGLLHSKEVITPGTYKKVNSAPLTLAKKAVSKTLPSARIREFIFNRVDRIAMNGEVLEIDT